LYLKRINEQPSEFECTGAIIRDGRRAIIVTGEPLALTRAGDDAIGAAQSSDRVLR
jgi:hypothetical protein